MRRPCSVEVRSAAKLYALPSDAMRSSGLRSAGVRVSRASQLHDITASVNDTRVSALPLWRSRRRETTRSPVSAWSYLDRRPSMTARLRGSASQALF